MTARYVIALDQGTTSSRSMLIDAKGNVCGVKQRAFRQIYPQPGWVEHDPMEILSSQFGTLAELIAAQNLTAADINSIGITNQRETTIVWDRETGRPIANAIVWQCRRTADDVAQRTADPAIAAQVTQKTGLVPDAYFSASKIAWILDHVPGARARAEAGELAFGTVDTWLIWALTNGRVHATDPTNASRTMLYNIHTGTWDPWLLDLFDVPAPMLPEVRPSSGSFGAVARPGELAGVPLAGVAGDQQAALFGQCCFDAGEAKNTYGTGCFLLMNAGTTAPVSTHGLVTTVAASAPPHAGGPACTEYALEGSVFVSGALIQWLRDELGLVDTAAETEDLARSVEDTAGVYIVPAFTGLGAPYWNANARGSIFGLTRGATKAHVVRAALESLAYQLYDLVRSMEADAGTPVSSLNVDGGASANGFLLQFQSDLLDRPLRRPQNAETTALGAAFLAGLSEGFWSDTQELRMLRAEDDIFEPEMAEDRRAELITDWKRAVRAAQFWADDDIEAASSR